LGITSTGKRDGTFSILEEDVNPLKAPTENYDKTLVD